MNTLIGREEEIARLQQALAAARGGQGGLILLAGEAGVGKTRLAEESLRESKLNIFTGRATEEINPAYGLIASALRDYMRQFPKSKIDCAPNSDYLALLMPELGNPPGKPDRDMLTQTIVSAVACLTENGPAAIFLEDLQWADDATLEVLPALSDHLRNESVLILATYRNDEIPRNHRLRWLRNELRRTRLLNEFVLGPLNIEDTRTLISHTLEDTPSSELVQLIHERTHGVPLFVEELADALKLEGALTKGDSGLELIRGREIPIPESVRDAVLLRLDKLPAEARNQLEVAAVAGLEFDLDLVMQLAGTETGLDALFESNIIVEIESGRGAFRHALTREAVRNEVMWSRRRALNREIATYLESKDAFPEIIAEHWLAANELKPARQALVDSAARSCHIHAYSDAARAAFRALEIWPAGEDEENRLAALQRLAHCAQISGRLSDAVRALREMIQSPIIQKDNKRFAEAQRALATVHGLQGAWEQSIAARQKAAESFQKAGLLADAAVECLAAATRSTGMMQLNNAIELANQAADLAEQVERYDIQARALGLKGNLLAIQGSAKEGCEIIEAGLSLALEHNFTEAASEVYRRLASALDYASEYEASREAYLTAYNYCQNQGADGQAQMCLGCMSWVLFRTGDWKRAVEVCRETIKEADEPSRAIALVVYGLIRVHRGEVRPARKYLDEALAIAKRYGNPPIEMLAFWGLAIADTHDGDAENAAIRYRRVLEIREQTNDVHDGLLPLCSAASFFSEQSMEKEMTMCADALASISSSTGNIEALAGLAFALGENASLNGKPKEASTQFIQAASQFQKLDVPLELAKTQIRAGMTLAEAGQQDAAVQHLTNAYRSARKLGARPLAALAAKELEKLGETVEDRRSEDAPERAQRVGLTRRQIEILQLLAEGITNKEIAAKLYLSTRTVDMHVGHILERLDCRTRTEAVKKATDLGLVG